MKTFIKKKSGPNAAGPKFRTSDHFKGSIFGAGASRFSKGPQLKFKPSQFRTQHKGG